LEDGENDVEETDSGKTETGIEIGVKLPNKRVKGLDMLSGGESSTYFNRSYLCYESS